LADELPEPVSDPEEVNVSPKYPRLGGLLRIHKRERVIASTPKTMRNSDLCIWYPVNQPIPIAMASKKNPKARPL
jgi:hypothetical protein